MNIDYFIIFGLLIVVIYSIIYIYFDDKICVKSDINNVSYLVKDSVDKNDASDLLGTISEKIKILSNYLMKNINNYPDYRKYIKKLHAGTRKIILVENSSNDESTSYTINKGEKMAICLRSKKSGKIHDENLITYVVIHELAHIACPEKNHTDKFVDIFIFLQKIAIKIGIYNPANYDISPREYCGIIINENLL